MSWHGKRLPSFVAASSEEKLMKVLGQISVGIGEKLEIMTIYPRGGRVVAWYFLDVMKANQLPEEAKQTKKKRTKKKAK